MLLLSTPHANGKVDCLNVYFFIFQKLPVEFLFSLIILLALETITLSLREITNGRSLFNWLDSD